MGEVDAWVLRYCERGIETGALSEPLNAASNLGFILAALAIAHVLRRDTARRGEWRATLTVLIGLVVLVGFGSLAFHVHPSRLAEAGDVAPIGAFMMVALWMALRVVFGADRRRALVAIGAFAAVSGTLGGLALVGGCGQPLVDGNRLVPLDVRCLNGGLAYLPCLGMLVATAWQARERRWFALAAVAFLLALTGRSLDLTLCAPGGASVMLTGHAIWHLGAAATVFAVLRGLVEAAGPTSAKS